MKCKFEHDGDCCNCGSPQYMCKCKPDVCGSAVPMTNADRIRAMSDGELAQEILRRWRAEMETGKFEDISTRWCDMKGGCVSSKGYHRPCTEDRLLACIKRWLRQPAEAQT